MTFYFYFGGVGEGDGEGVTKYSVYFLNIISSGDICLGNIFLLNDLNSLIQLLQFYTTDCDSFHFGLIQMKKVRIVWSVQSL